MKIKEFIKTNEPYTFMTCLGEVSARVFFKSELKVEIEYTFLETMDTYVEHTYNPESSIEVKDLLNKGILESEFDWDFEEDELNSKFGTTFFFDLKDYADYLAECPAYKNKDAESIKRLFIALVCNCGFSCDAIDDLEFFKDFANSGI